MSEREQYLAGDPALAEELAAIDALPPYVAREKAWKFLGISEATLDRALDRGQLARRRIGGNDQGLKGRTMIPRASIRAWVLRQAGVEAEHDNGGALTRLPVRMEVPKPQTERSAT